MIYLTPLMHNASKALFFWVLFYCVQKVEYNTKLIKLFPTQREFKGLEARH